MSTSGLISIEKSVEKVVKLTINRPKALNALNTSLLDELDDCLNNLACEAQGAGDASEVRVRALVIQGGGERAFVAGADVKEFMDLSPSTLARFIEVGQQVTERLASFPAPTIACVRGYCLGGGFELALACDFIMAGNSSVFGFPEVGLGLIPGFGGTQRIMRRVGSSAAKNLIFTGAQLSGAEAYRLNIINGIFPEEELVAEVAKFSSTLASNPPLAIQAAKRVIDSNQAANEGFGLGVEKREFLKLFFTKDAIEGRTAFVENRKPTFEK